MKGWITRTCYPFRLYVIRRWQRPVHFVVFLCIVLIGLLFWKRMFRNHVVACRPVSCIDSVVSDLSLPNLQEVMDADALSPSYSISTPTTIASLSPFQQPYSSLSSLHSPYHPSCDNLDSINSYSNSTLPNQSHSPSHPYPSQSPSHSYLNQSPSHPYPNRSPSHLNQNSSSNKSTPRSLNSTHCSRSQKPPTLRSFQGRLVDASRDNATCRVLQQLLDDASLPSVRRVFKELKPHLVDLMMDPCGNYIFQKLVERGDDALRNNIVSAGVWRDS